MSGYMNCACRDCFEIVIGSGPTLCDECQDSGCTNHDNLPGFMTGYGLGYECQREDVDMGV